MESRIEWENSLDKAKGRAHREHKPILLDFFNPG
jgi:hypothetical protein